MSTSTVSFSRATLNLMTPVAVIAFALCYLGVTPISALLLSTWWMATGVFGSWILQIVLGRVSARHLPLLILGPGALLGMGLVVATYLAVGGNMVAHFAALGVFGIAAWKQHTSSRGQRIGSQPSPIETREISPATATFVLLGGALLANAKQFPNLLIPGVAVLLATMVMHGRHRLSLRILFFCIAGAALANDVFTRADYWWVTSDDTTTLAGVGTMIIERGRIADTAGWPTSSHHWLLHAWLALWNNLSLHHVFETYLIAWPLVAAMSLSASLWIGLELFLGRSLDVKNFALVLAALAGIVRFEWTAPQEQQPYVFALVACSALLLSERQSRTARQPAQTILAIVLGVVVLPVGFYVLKPSLLVAYGLLLVGTAAVWLGLTHGTRLFIAVAVSFLAIASGITLMSLGESVVSGRSFTKITIGFFPRDLGWCQADSSRLGSLACIFSLQALLFAGGLLALVVIWVLRRHVSLAVSPLVLMPLILAYVPLRYFVNSDVGSGSPSFYRLPEMAVMLVIAIGLAAALVNTSLSNGIIFAAVAIALLANRVGQGPGDIYDWVDSILTSSRFSRFLNATDVTALVIALVAGVMLSQLPRFRARPARHAVMVLLLVSLLPMTRIGLKSWNAEPAAEHASRPAYLGPADIEEVSTWMRENTKFGTLYATNFLCPSYRLDECSREKPEIVCARRHPVLFASWALTALSRREFLYLSQDWSKGNNYFSHRLSTQLGSEVSLAAVDALANQGVDFYVVSRIHSNPRAWSLLRDAAEVSTENFALVSLSRLQRDLA